MELKMKDGTVIETHTAKNDRGKFVGYVEVVEPVSDKVRRVTIHSVMGEFKARSTAQDYVESEAYQVRKAIRKERKKAT